MPDYGMALLGMLLAVVIGLAQISWSLHKIAREIERRNNHDLPS